MESLTWQPVCTGIDTWLNFKMKKKIIVTGGAGFIGSHTVVELLNRDFDVMILDDLSNSHKEVISSIGKITSRQPAFHQVDLCNKELTLQKFSEYKPDAIIHFAAKKLVGESVEKPLLYYGTNIISLINVVEAAAANQCNNLVFSSSCTVYGQPQSLPVDENEPLKKPESPYGNTKKISEEILSDYSMVNPFRVISLRYFNPVGAHESALIGEYPLGTPSNLMPVLTQSAIGKRGPFQVFGNDYNTPDGSCIRDYIHVVDLAEAHVAAIQHLLKSTAGSSFEVFNVGTGTGISVFEIIKCFEEVNGLKLNYSVAARRPGDVEQVWANTERANKSLGWKAKKGLDEMVSSAWKWEQHLSKLN